MSAIHEPDCIAIYGESRIFLSCEPLSNADALLAAIADSYGIGRGHVISDLTEVLSEGVRSLLVLDNFETLWEDASRTQAVESVLSDLSGIAGLTLLITMRGSQRPSNVDWAKPFIPPLTSLTPAAAKATFMAISDSQCPEDDVDDVLALLDNVPLAVTLMANLAQHTPCTELLARWNHDKTSMVNRGLSGDRLSSLDMSIRLSLTSERMIRTPHAIEILKILALMPDGLSKDQVLQMCSNRNDAWQSMSTLRQVALIYDDLTRSRGGSQGVLRVLTPIREHITRYLEVASCHFYPVLEHYLHFAESSPFSSKSSPDDRDWSDLRFQLGNVSVVFMKALSEEQQVPRTIRALLGLGELLNLSGVSRQLASIALEAARRCNNKSLEADCLLAVAEFAWFPNQDYSVKKCLLEEATTIYRDLNVPQDAVQMGRCIDLLSEMFFRSGELEKGISLSLEAVSILAQTVDVGAHVTALWRLSRWYGMTQQLQPGIQHATSALKLATEHHLYSLLPRIHYSLAFIHVRRYDFAPSEYHLHAMSRCQKLILGDETKQAAQAANTRGEILLLRSRMDEAEAAFDRAHYIFKRIGLKNYKADHHFRRGELAMRKWEHDKALKHFQISMKLYQDMQYPCVSRCLVKFGEVEIQRGNFSTAVAHLNEARRVCRTNGELSLGTEALALGMMGDADLHSGFPADALAHFVPSLIIHVRENDLLDIACGIRRIGEYLAAVHDFQSAKSCFAVAFGLLEPTGVLSFVAECHERRGACAVSEANSEEAHIHYSQALTLYKEIGLKELAIRCERRLSEL